MTLSDLFIPNLVLKPWKFGLMTQRGLDKQRLYQDWIILACTMYAHSMLRNFVLLFRIALR
mgnify:CR=1 FL=1